MIINATSLGLKKDENIILDYSKISPKNFFMMSYTIPLKLIS